MANIVQQVARHNMEQDPGTDLWMCRVDLDQATTPGNLLVAVVFCTRPPYDDCIDQGIYSEFRNTFMKTINPVTELSTGWTWQRSGRPRPPILGAYIADPNIFSKVATGESGTIYIGSAEDHGAKVMDVILWEIENPPAGSFEGVLNQLITMQQGSTATVISNTTSGAWDITTGDDIISLFAMDVQGTENTIGMTGFTTVSAVDTARDYSLVGGYKISSSVETVRPVLTNVPNGHNAGFMFVGVEGGEAVEAGNAVVVLTSTPGATAAGFKYTTLIDE